MRKGRGRPASPHAAFRRVAGDLRRRIRRGDLPPGTVLPPWRQLAREYRVGVRAIQLACDALKGDGLAARTPQRRLVARDWDSPGTALERQILVLMTTGPSLWLGGPISDELILGILTGAGEAQAPVLLAFDDRLRTGVPQELFERPLQGAVVVGKVGAKALRGYERLSVPVVLADHPGGAWKVHAAGVDNAWAIRESVGRLRAQGHRHIAFLRRMHLTLVQDVEPDSRERQAVFEALLREDRGASSKIVSVFPKDTPESPGLRALIRSIPPLTAAIASDPGCAGLAIQAARQAGRAVPRDLSVVAMDALSPKPSDFSGPRFDFRRVGREAVRLLMGRDIRRAT